MQLKDGLCVTVTSKSLKQCECRSCEDFWWKAIPSKLLKNVINIDRKSKYRCIGLRWKQPEGEVSSLCHPAGGNAEPICRYGELLCISWLVCPHMHHLVILCFSFSSLAPAVKNGLKGATDSSEDEAASEVLSSASGGKTSAKNAGAYAVPHSFQTAVRRLTWPVTH